MKKITYSVMSVLCSAFVTVLSFVGCKTSQTATPKYTEKMYGPPPVTIEETQAREAYLRAEEERLRAEADRLKEEARQRAQREKIKVVYGPPVVGPYDQDWREARPDADGIYDIVEEMPRFPGGERAMFDWMDEHQRYPEEARKEDIHGRVIVSFVVKKDGKLDGVMVKRSVHPALEAEAIRLVKAMPKWEPGRQNGEVVPVRYFIPIKF